MSVEVTLHRLVQDEGSVIIFEGVVSDENNAGRDVRVIVDHRIAQDLVRIIEDEGSAVVDAEWWQIS